MSSESDDYSEFYSSHSSEGDYDDLGIEEWVEHLDYVKCLKRSGAKSPDTVPEDWIEFVEGEQDLFQDDSMLDNDVLSLHANIRNVCLVLRKLRDERYKELALKRAESVTELVLSIFKQRRGQLSPLAKEFLCLALQEACLITGVSPMRYGLHDPQLIKKIRNWY